MEDVRDRIREGGFFRALSDVNSRKILLSTAESAKSAGEISRENRIPASTCYRLIRELEGFGFLKIENSVPPNSGRRFQTFRSTIRDGGTIRSYQETSVAPLNPSSFFHFHCSKKKRLSSER
jgi:hypothetical protein